MRLSVPSSPKEAVEASCDDCGMQSSKLSAAGIWMIVSLVH